MLGFHVATLAEADKVRQVVSLCHRRKLSKWADVMNWQALTDELPAMGTLPILTLNYGLAGFQPSPTSIGLGAANVVGCIFAGLVPGSILAATLRRTEIVLPTRRLCAPFWQSKLFPAHLAGKDDLRFPAWVFVARNVSGIKTVHRFVPLAVLVPLHKRIVASESGSLFSLNLVHQHAVALPGAGAGFVEVALVWRVRLTANFTDLLHGAAPFNVNFTRGDDITQLRIRCYMTVPCTNEVTL